MAATAGGLDPPKMLAASWNWLSSQVSPSVPEISQAQIGWALLQKN